MPRLHDFQQRYPEIQVMVAASDLPADLVAFKDDNARFFAEPLPGHDVAIGSPGGAAKLGVIDGDTELVAGHPPQGE